MGQLGVLAFQAVGSYFGPLGAAVGGVIGNALFNKPPTIHNEGPRLPNLKVSGSQFGENINHIYGSVRTAVQMFWACDIKETKNTETKRVGKGGGQKVENTTYTNTFTGAFLICKGEIDGVRKIWANGELAYDNSTENTGAVGGKEDQLIIGGIDIGKNININQNGWSADITIYNGTMSQPVDDMIESIEGVGNYTAHRGYSYFVVKNMDLAKWNGSIPQLNVEAIRSGIAHTIKLGKETLTSATNPNTQSILFNERDSYLYVMKDSRYILKINPFNNPATIEATYDRGSAVLGANNFTMNFTNSGDLCVNSGDGGLIIDTKSMIGIKSFLNNDVYQNYPYLAGSSRNGEKLIFDENALLHYNLYYYSDDHLLIHKYDATMIPITFSNIGMNADPNYTSGWQNPLFTLYDFDQQNEMFYTATTKTSGGAPYDMYISSAGLSYVNYKQDLVKTSLVSQIVIDDVFFDAVSRCLFVKYNYTGPGAPSYILKFNVDTRTVVDDRQILISGLTCAGQSQRLQTNQSREFYIYSYETGGGQAYVVYYDMDTSELNYTIIDYTVPWGGTGPNNLSLLNQSSAYIDINNCEYYLRNLVSSNDFNLLKNYGYRLDQGKFNLAQAVQEISQFNGLDITDIDVTELASDEIRGYIVNNESSGRGVLEQWSYIYNFAEVESEYKIKFRKNGNTSIKTIYAKDLGVKNYGADIDFEDMLSTTRADEKSLPRTVSLTYCNQDFDYENDTQVEKIIGISSDNNISNESPVVLIAQEAKEVVSRAAYTTIINRDSFEFSVNYDFIELEPLDVVTLIKDDSTFNIKITKIERNGGIIKISGVSEDATVYTQDKVVGFTTTRPTQTIKILSNSKGIYMDTPAVRNNDLNDAGFYCAAVPQNTALSWPGAILLSSPSSLDGYKEEKTFETRPRFGVCTSILSNWAYGNTIDYYNSVDVQLNNELTLTSCTETELLNFENLCKIGNEFLCFKNATLIGTNKYRLDTFLRGRFNTEDSISTHAAGDSFILFEANGSVNNINQDISQVGLSKYYKMTTFEQYVEMTSPDTFTNQGLRTQCYPIFNLISLRMLNGTINFGFNKRVRGKATSLDQNNDVYDVDGDVYEVDIYNGSGYTTVLRTIKLQTTTGSYSTADQVSDFTANQATVYVKIYKLNKWGYRGKVFTSTI